DDDDADVKQNADARFERNQAEHGLDGAGETEKANKDAVQSGITGARAEAFPTRMTDINRRRKHAAEQRGDDRTDAICHQRGKRAKAVTGGLGALDVLQRSNHVENPHGKNYGKIIEKG